MIEKYSCELLEKLLDCLDARYRPDTYHRDFRPTAIQSTAMNNSNSPKLRRFSQYSSAPIHPPAERSSPPSLSVTPSPPLSPIPSPPPHRRLESLESMEQWDGNDSTGYAYDNAKQTTNNARANKGAWTNGSIFDCCECMRIQH